MECVRKLVYAKNTDKLEAMYQRLKEDAAIYKSMQISRNIWKVTGSAVVNGLYASEIKPYLEETIPIIMSIVWH